jgi:hypothetical protein
MNHVRRDIKSSPVLSVQLQASSVSGRNGPPELWNAYAASLVPAPQVPPDFIRLAVWLYVPFTLSFRDVEEMLAQRGMVGGG